MMERTRVLMYSERTSQDVFWWIFYNEYNEIFCVTRFDDAAKMLRNFTFQIIIIDYKKIRRLKELTDIMLDLHINAKVMICRLPETEQGYRAHTIRAPSETKETSVPMRTKTMREADEKAGIEQNEVLYFDDLEIDMNSRKVKFRSSEIDFTPTQFEILHCLASHYNKVLTYKQIKIYVWGEEYYGDETVRSHITEIRKKLLTVTGQKYIENERGVGYRFSK